MLTEVIRRDLLHTYMKHGFDDEDDLDFYIQTFLGIKLPRHNFCVGHTSAFKFVSDVVLEKVFFALAFGSRGSGKTLDFALINHLKMLFRQRPVESVVAASTIDQTNNGYGYFKGFLERDPVLWEQLDGEPIQSRTKFKNKSLLQITAGTMRGLNGPHPNIVCIDEVELMDLPVLEQGLSMSFAKNGVPAQDILGCVVGDTCIDVPRNLEEHPKGIPIKNLVGTKGWVYSFNHDSGKVTIKPYNKVWKTGHKKIYKLTYEWIISNQYGTKKYTDFIKLTGNHLVMLRDGTYRRVDELQINDAIMPLNRREENGYTFINRNDGTEIAEHILVCGKTGGGWADRNNVVHHKDFTPLNNAPDNLQLMTRTEHTAYHRSLIRDSAYLKENGKQLGEWNRKFWVTPSKEREKRREYFRVMTTNAWKTPEGRAARYRASQTEEQKAKTGRTLHRNFVKKTGLSNTKIDKKVMKVAKALEYPEKVGYKAIADYLRWPYPRVYESLIRLGILATHKQKMTIRKDNKNKELKEKYGRFLQMEYIEKKRSLRSLDMELGLSKNSMERIAKKLGISLRTRSQEIQLRYQRMSEEDKCKLQERMQRASNIRLGRENHKVVSVVPCGFEDVYDMEVEDTHNFAANGILLHNSTRKKSGGTMSTLLDEQEQRNLSVYQFCIWETLEQCTRECKNDPEWGDCIAWDKCQGKAHTCKGWYPIPTFIQKTANLSTAMFSTEWENKSPSGGAKVYGEYYDENIHIISMLGGGRFRSFQSIFQEKDIPKNWRRIAGMDFGSHFAYIQIAIEPRYDIWIVIFEYYFHGDRLLGTHAQNIKRYPYWRPRLPIFSDPSGKTSILEMRNYGLNCIPAMNDLAEGVDEVKKRLEVNPATGLPKLFIMDSCIELRREFNTWEHGVLPDGKPDLDTFEDGNDHAVDSLRYPVFTYPRMPKSHVKATTVAGL